MTTFKQIQNKLLEAISKSNLTKQEIAKQIGIQESTFENYLSGNSKPSLYTFAKICTVLNLDANEILCVVENNSNDG
ncbi:MAG: helix-turn-helix domain-containing protein [Clostridia bacterium]|nr:helix-turn-helix domain-containing protein [Clostridia bacterium]